MQMPFGIHKDKDMEKVPADYLHFIYSKRWISSWPTVLEYINNNLAGIKKELKDSGKSEYTDY